MNSRIFPSLAAAGLCLLGSAAAQDPRLGLVAYWPMDSLANGDTEAPDLANGYSLTLYNMDATNLVVGQRGNAMSFDGSSEMLVRDLSVQPATGLPLINNAARTIAMWVKGVGSTQSDKRIFAESSTTSTNPIYDLGTPNNATNALDIFLRSTGATTVINHQRSTGLPLDGTWHHVAITDGGGACSIYVDGAFDRSFTYTNPTLATNIVSIGALRRSTDSSFFNGQVDDVALWNRKLTAAEILSVKENGLGNLAEPLIQSPTPQPYRQGDRVTLSASAYGGGTALTYQWKHEGTEISGATERTYVIGNLQNGVSGAYTVVVNGLESPAFNVTFTADPTPDLPLSLVSWWPLNTLDTGVTPPTSPDPYGGNTLNCYNMTDVSLSAGMFGNALTFDGISTYGARSTGFPIYNNTEFTVSLWVKGDGTAQSDVRVFAESSSTSNAPLFTLGTATGSSSLLRAYIRTDANAVSLAQTSTTPVFDGNWHHLVWSETNGRVRLYIDGTVDGASFDYTRGTLTLDRTTLGAIERAVVSSWFNGQIDDAAVWNRALTWSEVQILHTTGVPAPVTAVAPSFTSQPPPSITVYETRNVKLAVEAVGTGPLSYQWFRGPTLLDGETQSTLTLDNIQPSSAGSYTCTVTNSVDTITSIPSVVTVIPIVPLVTGKVSLWPLDAGDVTTPDIVGSQALTLFGMDSTGFANLGIKNNCVTLDGADDVLVRMRTNVDGDTPLTTRPEFTIAFWVKAEGTGQSDRRIFAEGSSTDNDPLFTMGTHLSGTNQAITFYVRNDIGTVAMDHVSTVGMPLNNQWHHVVVTDNRGLLKVYIDGVADLERTYTRPVSTLDSVSVGGISRAARSHWLNGQLDEFSTWERALTLEEITALYQEGLAASPKPVITAFERVGGNLRLEFTGGLGIANYMLQTTDSFAPFLWINEVSVPIVSLGNNRFEVTVPIPPSGTLFYRIAGF